MSLVDEKLIQVELIAADQQQADQLSKPCVSPLDEWRKNEDLLGQHPDITAMLQVVNKKFNKRSKETDDADKDLPEVIAYRSYIRAKNYPLIKADQEEFATVRKTVTENLMRFYDENH